MTMTPEHKAALAQGRRESRAVKGYLKALQSRRPGRPVNSESLRKRVETIEGRLGTESDPLKKLELHQEKLDADDMLKSLEAKRDAGQMQAEFVKEANSYSERKGISYSAWRQMGVPAAVLKEAGIPRTRRS